MSHAKPIPFEEWLAWMFDRADRDWAWAIEEADHPWLRNGPALTEYFIRLHEAPLPSVAPFSNDQIGGGLWWLYSSYAAVGAPFLDDDVAEPRRQAAVRSVGSLVRQLVPARLPPHDQVEEDDLARTIYMFWEVLPLWPDSTTGADLALRGVCFEEMESCLQIDHPIARFHALHGLGHFALLEPDRSCEIIDRWLSTGPSLSPVLAEYAQNARLGRVQ